MIDRSKDILSSVTETISEAAQKTYMGKKRSELKDSDFLFPETRSFPIVSPADIPDAISNFGRMKGQMSYDAFLKKLYNFAKKKGPQFVASFPKATKDKLGIKTTKACDMITNEYEDDEYDNEEENDPMEMEIETLKKEIELELLKQKLMEIKKSKAEDGDFTKIEEMEVEDPEMEMMEYKNDFYQMSLGSIKSIATHANVILQALDNPSVKEALTESWLQGKIAVTEDYMLTIHNFVMFGSSETDTEGSETEAKKKLKIKDLPHYQYQDKEYPGVTTHEDTMSAQNKPGLWENIRKKKEKMGKKYKPAKPGDKDRPDPEAWKKAQK